MALAIVLIAAGIWLYRSGPPADPCPPEGMILISQSDIDSVNLLIASYVDSVRIDTVWLPSDTIYVRRTEPVTDPTSDPEINISSDSLITDYYKVWIQDFYLGNSIMHREWQWTEPRPIIITKTIKVPEIQFVKEKKIVPAGPLRQVLISGGVGVGTAGVPVMVRTQYINQKQISYGIQYQRFMDKGFVMVDAGFVIKSW